MTEAVLDYLTSGHEVLTTLLYWPKTAVRLHALNLQ